MTRRQRARRDARRAHEQARHAPRRETPEPPAATTPVWLARSLTTVRRIRELPPVPPRGTGEPGSLKRRRRGRREGVVLCSICGFAARARRGVLYCRLCPVLERARPGQ